MNKTGRPSNKNYNDFTIFYSNGDMINGSKVANKVIKEYKKEEKRYYEIKEGRRVLHIPKETAKFIALTSVGATLSDVNCAHCKKTIMMLFNTIRDEQMEVCPLCNRNIYDIKDKKVRKVW